MKKVLLTSADRDFLDSNTILLKERNFEFFTATSGAKAFKLHEEHHFDLILADLELEDMSGSVFCFLLRKEENSIHVPVILICDELSGSMENIDKSGANAMLLKPIDQIQLLETIGRFTGLQLGRSKRVVLKVIVISKEFNLEFVCFSHDISYTGILIETEHEFNLGNRIICQFTLPNTYTIKTKENIARDIKAPESTHLYGVKFIDLSVSARRLIESYINS